MIAVWEGRITENSLDEIIISGEFGAKHVFAKKCFEGDIKMLVKLLDKLFANKQAVETNYYTQDIDMQINRINELIDSARMSALSHEVVSV